MASEYHRQYGVQPADARGWWMVVEDIKPEVLLENLDPVSNPRENFKGYKLSQDIDKW